MAPAPRRRQPGWLTRLWAWYLRSPFQKTWMRLAIQAGTCAFAILCIFSTPAVWELHSLDPILANPVLIMVMANLGLLFTANTGLPATKLSLEFVYGSLLGGAATYFVVYLAYAINGCSSEPGALKAAMLLVFGAPLLLVGTASRYRWPQHFALAGTFFNLTLAVGITVSYHQTTGLWKFVVYWWWFIGLAVAFLVVVATLVLPLPAGWVVRKQVARALRQEGAVLEAIVALLTAEDGTEPLPGKASSMRPAKGPEGLASGTLGSRSMRTNCALSAAASADPGSGVAATAAGALRGNGSQEGEGAGEEDGEEEEDFPPSSAQVTAAERLDAALRRWWRRGRRTMARVSSLPSLRSSRSRWDLGAAAEALGVHPDLYPAVEPIYAMSGPAADSISVARAHLRYTHFEVDLYRPTRRFPAPPFLRMLVLARTLLSAAMMVLYALQTGQARLRDSRRYAGQLRRVASEVKRCCRCLSAVLRCNAPVAPALHQLAQLEAAFLELQQAVGAAGTAGAAGAEGAAHAGPWPAAGHSVVQAAGEAAAAAAKDAPAAAEPAAVPAAASPGDLSDEGSPREGPRSCSSQPGKPEPAGGADLAGADVAHADLTLHLALSMLFTCCTRVRSMYRLLPDLLARDQAGVEEAVEAHFAGARAWEAVMQARAGPDAAGLSPGNACDVFRHTEQMWRGGGGHSGGLGAGSSGLRSSTSAVALGKLSKPDVLAAEPSVPSQPEGRLQRAAGAAQRAVQALERWTGYSRNQLALGLQMAVAFIAAESLVFVPAVHAALAQRGVWAVFIIVVVAEPLLGSVIWKCVLRITGTVLAGLLGLGALYFAFLCNGLSFENEPPKFIAMTVALTVLTMPLAAGTAYFGLRNAYFWIVSCLLMYTVALPGYAHTSPMPVLALWRLACTAIGLAIELLVALLVFPVTARSAAHATAAGVLHRMADVADAAFHSVLPQRGDEGAHRSPSRQHTADSGAVFEVVDPEMAAIALQSSYEPRSSSASPEKQSHASLELAGRQGNREQQGHAWASQDGGEQHEEQQQQHGAAHVAITCPPGGGAGAEAAGLVLTRIQQPMMDAYGGITTLRALLVPLRVEYHPFLRPTRFPMGPGRRAQRLCRRLLNVLTLFAVVMDSHHTQSVPLLEPHAAELEGLVRQLQEALRALGAMVAGAVTLASAARTVAALEAHAQHLLLRVLLSGPPSGLPAADATQTFMAMLFNATSVARLLCIALGQAFCPADTEGQAAAAELLRGSTRWAGDDRLLALAAELMSEAVDTAVEEAEGVVAPCS